MTVEMPDDGFITPEGEIISIKDADRMLSFLTQKSQSVDKIKEVLWSLAHECAENGYFDAACAYVSKLLSLADTSAEKASCLLVMGQALEQARNYELALETYARAFDLPQESDKTWYFLHNNFGYCLNVANRHQEAEMHCRAAIKIDPDRHNAHKNLGIALQGLGRYCDAARSYILASMACPENPRALGHLKHLIAAHWEVLEQDPDLLEQLREYQEVVQAARVKPRVQ